MLAFDFVCLFEFSSFANSRRLSVDSLDGLVLVGCFLTFFSFEDLILSFSFVSIMLS